MSDIDIQVTINGRALSKEQSSSLVAFALEHSVQVLQSVFPEGLEMDEIRKNHRHLPRPQLLHVMDAIDEMHKVYSEGGETS